MKISTLILLIVWCFASFMGGRSYEYLQTKETRIAFNKEVKHQEHFIKWKLGELYNWDNKQRLDGKITQKIVRLERKIK